MTPHPIIFRKLVRRGSERLVVIEEVVRGDTISRTLAFDERTFSELERVLTSHPFPKRPAVDDIVLFRSLETPQGDSQKYFGLLVVNGGSRRHTKISASDEVFVAMKAVFDSWSARIQDE
jgi:hypothetical protein